MSILVPELFGKEGPMQLMPLYASWHRVANDPSSTSSLDTILAPSGISLAVWRDGPSSTLAAIIHGGFARDARVITPCETIDLRERSSLDTPGDIFRSRYTIATRFPVTEILLCYRRMDGPIYSDLNDYSQGTNDHDHHHDLGGIADLLAEAELASLETASIFSSHIFGSTT